VFEFLTRFIDSDTGLPAPSYDLWEERVGEHTYSVPQYMRALKPVLKRHEFLVASEELIEKWEKAASDMKASIEKNFGGMRPEDSSEVCALSSIHGEVNIRPTRR